MRGMEDLGARVVYPLEDVPDPEDLKYEGESLHSIACLSNLTQVFFSAWRTRLTTRQTMNFLKFLRTSSRPILNLTPK